MAENFCAEHQQIWFKKGAMKSYAHPIKDDNGVTTGWCNKPAEDKPPIVTEAKKLGATEESVTPRADPQEIGMWQKEVGEWLRSGKLTELIEKGTIDKETAVALRSQYWAKMATALGVKTQGKQPKGSVSI